MGKGAWQATVHGVADTTERLINFRLSFFFNCEKMPEGPHIPMDLEPMSPDVGWLVCVTVFVGTASRMRSKNYPLR